MITLFSAVVILCLTLGYFAYHWENQGSMPRLSTDCPALIGDIKATLAKNQIKTRIIHQNHVRELHFEGKVFFCRNNSLVLRFELNTTMPNIHIEKRAGRAIGQVSNQPVTHDKVLDNQYQIQAQPANMVYFTETFRNKLCDLPLISLSPQEMVVDQGVTMPQVLTMLEVAQHLRLSPTDFIFTNLGDSLADVRLANLKLAETLGLVNDSRLQAALETLRFESDKRVAFRVANISGTLSTPLLIEGIKSPSLDDALAGEILPLLVKCYGKAVEDALIHLLQANQLSAPLLYEALHESVKRGRTESDRFLAKLHVKANDPAMRSKVIHMAGVLATPNSLTFMRRLLVSEFQEKSYTDDARLILSHLSNLGRHEDVADLHQLLNQTVNPISKKLLKETIAKIQSRLSNTEAGMLALFEAEDHQGGLSLPTTSPAGALSHPLTHP